ncbi:hypothetical protein ACHAAC_13180 [Aeromicrobium sp. CF4.19]|uniref:hypothetical protein n=1 Tax=Aeromicrobium sp. CF4.19 TaxID=3373082 RepID=UPI003EE61C3D
MAVRPCLAPGTVVVRHDARRLRIGIDPGLVVPDRPGLLELLRMVDGIRSTQGLAELADPCIAPDVLAVVDDLLARGALIDANRPRHRPRLDVAVRADRSARDLAAATRTVVDGLALAPAGPSGPGLVVHVTGREPARSLLEPLVTARLPHLLVTVLETGVRVGPLVVPGLSPCVSCLDLARGERDPAWPAVLAQLEGHHLATGPTRLHASTVWSVAAAAAREVWDVARDRRPSTAGGTVLHGPAGGPPRREPLAFHHRCGCWLLDRPR